MIPSFPAQDEVVPFISVESEYSRAVLERMMSSVWTC